MELEASIWQLGGRALGEALAEALFPRNPAAKSLLGALGEHLGPSVLKDLYYQLKTLEDEYGMPGAFKILKIAWEMIQDGDVSPERLQRALPKAVQGWLHNQGDGKAPRLPRPHTRAAAAVDVLCPESGNTITLEHGGGTYTCPDCKQRIALKHSKAVHAHEVECPVHSATFWVGPGNGTYECPECDGDVVVEDSEAEHAYLQVRCPRSGDTITLTQGEGVYTCPDCKGEIVVDEYGEAEHERCRSR